MKLSDFNLDTQKRLREQMQRDDTARLARLSNPQPESDSRGANAGEIRREAGRPGRMAGRTGQQPGIMVSIVSHRRRMLDDDNLAAGAKALRDAICESLRIDDGRTDLVRFEYGQVVTKGKCGTVVKIEAAIGAQLV